MHKPIKWFRYLQIRVNRSLERDMKEILEVILKILVKLALIKSTMINRNWALIKLLENDKVSN